MIQPAMSPNTTPAIPKAIDSGFMEFESIIPDPAAPLRMARARLTGEETAVHDAAPMRLPRSFAVSCGLLALAGMVAGAQKSRDRHNTRPCEPRRDSRVQLHA